MEESKTLRQIDFVAVYHAVLKHKKTIAIILATVFVLSCIYILSIPRYYTCTIKMAPESSSMSASSLSGLAASFGFDLGNMSQSNDAIFPELYPELLESTNFQTSLFTIQVQTNDGSLTTDYYDYLQNHQKSPWWSKITQPIKKLFQEKDSTTSQTSVDPFRLTKRQSLITKIIENNISCVIDKKTFVISLTVTDQDPLVCATMADSVRVRLLNFIIDYRTNKAKIDLAHTEKLQEEAREEYEKARMAYSQFSDSNLELVLQRYNTKKDALENEMQIKYNSYSAYSQQVVAAKARLQERTPAFTTLQSATVPIKPAGPKRMIFVAAMLILSFIATTVYFAKKEGCLLN